MRISAFLSSRHKTGRLDCSADRFSQSRIELPTKRPASPAAASSQPRDSHSKEGTLPAIGFSSSALASHGLSFRDALRIHLRGHLSAQRELPLCNFPAVFAGCGFEHCVRINANGIPRAFSKRQVISAVGKEKHIFKTDAGFGEPLRKSLDLSFLKSRYADNFAGTESVFKRELNPHCIGKSKELRDRLHNESC